jgi:holo-[acyl-carrier protein] synthase
MADSIGIDIAEVARFQRLLDRYGERVVTRVLSSREAEILARRHDRAAFLAGRFAAKEAIVKALGKYLLGRPSMNSIEILNDATGRPSVQLPEPLAAELARVQIEVSISHERSHAVGLAVCTEKS